MRFYKSIYFELAEEEDSTPFESDLYDMLLQLKAKYPTLDWDASWEKDTAYGG